MAYGHYKSRSKGLDRTSFKMCIMYILLHCISKLLYIKIYIICICVCMCIHIFIYIRANEALQSITFNDSLSKTRGWFTTLVPVLMRETFWSHWHICSKIPDCCLLLSYVMPINFIGHAQNWNSRTAKIHKLLCPSPIFVLFTAKCGEERNETDEKLQTKLQTKKKKKALLQCCLTNVSILYHKYIYT